MKVMLMEEELDTLLNRIPEIVAYRSADVIMSVVKRRVDVSDSDKLDKLRDYLFRQIRANINRKDLIRDMLREKDTFYMSIDIEPKFFEKFLETEFFTRSRLFVEISLDYARKIYLTVSVREIRLGPPNAVYKTEPDVVL